MPSRCEFPERAEDWFVPEECSAALLSGSSRSPSAYPVLCLKADTSSLLKHLFFPQLLSMATFLSLVVTEVAPHCTPSQCSLTPVHGLPKSRDGGTDREPCEKRRASCQIPCLELNSPSSSFSLFGIHTGVVNLPFQLSLISLLPSPWSFDLRGEL